MIFEKCVPHFSGFQSKNIDSGSTCPGIDSIFTDKKVIFSISAVKSEFSRSLVCHFCDKVTGHEDFMGFHVNCAASLFKHFKCFKVVFISNTYLFKNIKRFLMNCFNIQICKRFINTSYESAC